MSGPLESTTTLLPFVVTDDGFAAGEPIECLNPNARAMRADALSRKQGHVGAVAYSRTGDYYAKSLTGLRVKRGNRTVIILPPFGRSASTFKAG